VGLNLNGTYQLLSYADDVNLLGDSKAKKTTYMLLSCHKNAGQNHDMKTANRSFENLSQLKYFGMRVTNEKN
jgi:hypothetical protein